MYNMHEGLWTSVTNVLLFINCESTRQTFYQVDSGYEFFLILLKTHQFLEAYVFQRNKSTASL